MKTPALTAVAAFLLGVAFTLGSQWLLHGREEDSLTSEDRGSSPRKGKPMLVAGQVLGVHGKSGRQSPTPQTTEKAYDTLLDPDPGSRGKWLDHLVKRERMIEKTDLETRLALWVERLGLAEAQEAALREMMEQHLEARLAAMGADGGKAKKSRQQEELQAMLNGLLSDEQKEAYADLQETQRWNEIDSRAMRRLADLQLQLDLSETQRDQLLKTFHSQEVGRADSPSAGKGGYRAFIDGGGTQEGWREYREELVRVQREEELEQVRGIITERQLDAYRTFLERRSGGYDPARPRTPGVSPLIPGR